MSTISTYLAGEVYSTINIDGGEGREGEEGSFAAFDTFFAFERFFLVICVREWAHSHCRRSA
jgi:hypothetical protein